MSLEAKELGFGYRRKPVLEGINLTVRAGERVGLAAPSGRGKTTLCKLLAGYMRPNCGSVLLDGKPLPQKGYCPVQMIWQHPELALDPRMRLGDALAEAGADGDGRLLDALQIQPAWLSRFPRELSGGELQRFCIARALCKPVRFVLCDEISAMLDLVTQAQLWDFLLREAAQRQLGLLIVSHDAALLKRLCTRIEHI